MQFTDLDNEFDLVDQDTTSDEQVAINANVKKEILLYFAETRINREVDPLWYCCINLSLYPMLSILSFRYLNPPCGSVPSEREFKIASKISKGDRIRLLLTNIEKLLFLK